MGSNVAMPVRVSHPHDGLMNERRREHAAGLRNEVGSRTQQASPYQRAAALSRPITPVAPTFEVEVHLYPAQASGSLSLHRVIGIFAILKIALFSIALFSTQPVGRFSTKNADSSKDYRACAPGFGIPRSIDGVGPGRRIPCSPWEHDARSYCAPCNRTL
jgi:hypothetical protein